MPRNTQIRFVQHSIRKLIWIYQLVHIWRVFFIEQARPFKNIVFVNVFCFMYPKIKMGWECFICPTWRIHITCDIFAVTDTPTHAHTYTYTKTHKKTHSLFYLYLVFKTTRHGGWELPIYIHKVRSLSGIRDSFLIYWTHMIKWRSALPLKK